MMQTQTFVYVMVEFSQSVIDRNPRIYALLFPRYYFNPSGREQKVELKGKVDSQIIQDCILLPENSTHQPMKTKLLQTEQSSIARWKSNLTIENTIDSYITCQLARNCRFCETRLTIIIGLPSEPCIH